MGGHMQQMPLFQVKSDWELPKELPRLTDYKLIGLDTETRDPQLKEKGPGVRRDGYMVGISVAVPEGKQWYLPFGHAEGKQFEKEKIMQWAKDNLCVEGQAKVGANILYDLDYLSHEGVNTTGPFFDIQNAEPLIDENKRTYSLNTLAKQYLGESKQEGLMEEACRNMGYKGNPQKHLWKLDPKYVGMYAEADARQALQIFEKQQKVLRDQELENVFDVETRLIPMLLHMRKTGVPIDIDKLVYLHGKTQKSLHEKELALSKLAGTTDHIDIWAAASLAKIFDRMGMEYPMTPKTGKPSFKKDWLKNQDSGIAKSIMECRELSKFLGTFLEGSLLEMLVGDRIHCQFNQLRSDDSGTVTGRFSASNPNLQFIPIRTAEGKIIRECFIPDDGYNWFKADYSQIEIRVLAHYAMGKGSEEIVREFIANPKIDYHTWCAEQAGVTRSHAKTINFGIIYGMGPDKLALDLGISSEDARKFIANYYVKLPFIKETVGTATRTAEKRGYIKTILGRRRRFNLWEPYDYKLSKLVQANTDPAKVQYQMDQFDGFKSGLKRAGCYKAFNAADQGSSADIMKKAMVDIWESGICSVIKPYITVHDELDFGSPKTKEGDEAATEVQNIMENTYKLKVPVIVDLETGPNWGEVK